MGRHILLVTNLEHDYLLSEVGVPLNTQFLHIPLKHYKVDQAQSKGWSGLGRGRGVNGMVGGYKGHAPQESFLHPIIFMGYCNIQILGRSLSGLKLFGGKQDKQVDS